MALLICLGIRFLILSEAMEHQSGLSCAPFLAL